MIRKKCSNCGAGEDRLLLDHQRSEYTCLRCAVVSKILPDSTMEQNVTFNDRSNYHTLQQSDYTFQTTSSINMQRLHGIYACVDAQVPSINHLQTLSDRVLTSICEGVKLIVFKTCQLTYIIFPKENYVLSTACIYLYLYNHKLFSGVMFSDIIASASSSFLTTKFKSKVLRYHNILLNDPVINAKFGSYSHAEYWEAACVRMCNILSVPYKVQFFIISVFKEAIKNVWTCGKHTKVTLAAVMAHVLVCGCSKCTYVVEEPERMKLEILNLCEIKEKTLLSLEKDIALNHCQIVRT